MAEDFECRRETIRNGKGDHYRATWSSGRACLPSETTTNEYATTSMGMTALMLENDIYISWNVVLPSKS